MALVEPESRGDPESPLQWTCLSTRNLAGTLTAAGHACSAPTAARLLKAEGYSLQGNAKVAEGRQHPDRDAQFRYIARTAREHLTPASRSSRWTPRRKRRSATSPTAAPSGGPRATRSG